MASQAPPDRAARSTHRTRTAAVVFAGFCAFLTLFAPQPLLPLLAAAFGVSAGAAGLVLTASSVAVAAAAPFAGIVADRFGRKRVIAPAALLLALPTALAATSGSLGQLLFWRFWQGVLTPGIFAVTIAYINEEWREGTGAAMSAYVGGTVMGGFSGRMVAALVAAHSGWRWAFVVLGVLEALGGLAIWLWLPADRPRRVRVSVATAFAGMARHLANSQLLATYAVGFCVLFSMMATFTYVNFYLAAPPFRLGTTALGLIFTVYLVGAVVTPIAGRMIDRFGNRVALTIAFSAGMSGIALTTVERLPAVVVGLALCSTSVFVAHSAASSYIGSVAREARAAAVGLYVMFYYAGGSLGSALPGRFWSRGGWTACVLMVAAVQAITIGLAAGFWRPARQPAAPVPAMSGD